MEMYGLDPLTLLGHLERNGYPFLFFLTFVTFVLFMVVLTLDSPKLMGRMARFASVKFLKPVIAIGLSAVLLIGPVFAGVLICLICWTFLIFLYLPHRKYPGLLASVLFLLWGSIIPLREQVSLWLSDQEIQMLLSSYSEWADPDEKWRFSWLLEERPNDPLVHHAYVNYLKKIGEMEEAQLSLDKAERALGSKAWIYAERGLLAYLSRNLRLAEEMYTRAEEKGFSGAELYYNWSKLRFDMMDVKGSSEMYEKALKHDSEATIRYFQQETEAGVSHVDFLPPFWTVLSSALTPMRGLEDNMAAFTKKITPLEEVLDYRILLLLGSVYFLCFVFLLGGKHQPLRDAWFESKKSVVAVSSILILLPFLGAASLSAFFFLRQYLFL